MELQLTASFAGLYNIIFLLPAFPLLHYSGIETFEFPPTNTAWTIIGINMLITLSSDYLYVLAMLKTTPLRESALHCPRKSALTPSCHNRPLAHDPFRPHRLAGRAICARRQHHDAHAPRRRPRCGVIPRAWMAGVGEQQRARARRERAGQLIQHRSVDNTRACTTSGCGVGGGWCAVVHRRACWEKTVNKPQPGEARPHRGTFISSVNDPFLP